MEHLLLRSENEGELLRGVTGPGMAQLQSSPGASYHRASPWLGAPRHPWTSTHGQDTAGSDWNWKQCQIPNLETPWMEFLIAVKQSRDQLAWKHPQDRHCHSHMIRSCTTGQFQGRCGRDTHPVLTLHCSTLFPASSISSLRDSIFEGCTWKFVPEVLWAWLYLGKKSFLLWESISNTNLHLWLPWNWFPPTGNKPHSSRGFPAEPKGSKHTIPDMLTQSSSSYKNHQESCVCPTAWV